MNNSNRNQTGAENGSHTQVFTTVGAARVPQSGGQNAQQNRPRTVASRSNAASGAQRRPASGAQPQNMVHRSYGATARPAQRPQQSAQNPQRPASSSHQSMASNSQTRVIRTVSAGSTAQHRQEGAYPSPTRSYQSGAQNPQRSPRPQSGGGGGNRRRPPNSRTGGGKGGNEGGTLNSAVKAVIYIVFVLVVSGFLSIFGISVCNDVFAFVKPDNEVDVEIPEYATTKDIADILKQSDVIKFPSIFQLYANLRHDNGKYLAGDYTVTPSMNYDMLLSAFKEQKKPRSQISITIPEGYTIDEMIDLFVSKGIGTRDRFVEVIQNFDYDFWFVKEIDENQSESRRYRLEGYLFPDTYYFFTDSNEETVIYKLLVNFNRKFPESYRDRCEELGYTTDQIITLASMVQAEAKFASEYSTISSVFHNRLKSPGGETMGLLQSDPTLLYVLPELRGKLTNEDLQYDSSYNTYKYKGLPPGPICNPCLSAIQYALYPDDTNYYYFYAESNGYHLFAETYAEHQQNILNAK